MNDEKTNTFQFLEQEEESPPTYYPTGGGGQPEPLSVEIFLARAFDRVYSPEYLRAQEDFAYLKRTALIDRDRLILKETWQRIIQFFGLPPGTPKEPIGILKSLAGWNKPGSTSLKLLQALIIFPVNLLFSASKLAFNIVKLATEFLPYVLAKGSLKIFLECKGMLSAFVKAKSNKRGLGWALVGAIGLIGSLLSGAITAASHIAYFIGSAMTSPAENFRAAFKAGNELAEGGKAGEVVGVIFALVSALTTGCVYAVLFPLLLTQAPAVLPAIANGISQFIGLFSAQAGASAAAFFTTTLPAALTSFGGMISSALTILSSVAEPLLIGLAASAAIGASVMTPVVVATDEAGEMQGKEDGLVWFSRRIEIPQTQLKNIMTDKAYEPYYPPLLTIEGVKKALGKPTLPYQPIPTPIHDEL